MFKLQMLNMYSHQKVICLKLLHVESFIYFIYF